MTHAVDRALEHWPHVAPLLTAPRTETEYNRLILLLDELLDAGAADEAHPLAGLASAMGDLIEAYDEDRHPMPAVTGADLLRYLMNEHGLRQSDLPEVGPQPVVSAILAGQREINARQARVLAERFKVDAGVFLIPVEIRERNVGSVSRTVSRSAKMPQRGNRSPSRGAKGALRVAAAGSKASRTMAKEAKKAAVAKAGGATRSAAKTGSSASRSGSAKAGSSSRRQNPNKGHGPARG